MHTFLLFITAYLGLHFLLYAFFLRGLDAFYLEINILLYHLVSFLTFFAYALFLMAAQSPDFKWGIAMLSLHGIYSLSFLELWALSDGCYSLRILDRIEASGTSDLGFLEALGASKKRHRLGTLKRFRLVYPRPEGWTLTPTGRTVVRFVQFFLLLSEQKET